MTAIFEFLLRLLAALFGRTPAPSPLPTPAPPPLPAVPPWLSKAITFLGFVARDGYRGIQKFVDMAKCGADGEPWCAIFVNAMLESVGVHGSRSALARSFSHDPNFVKLSGPALGCIVVLWRQSPSSGLGHVFFYDGENEHGMVGLGGDQSSSVCRKYIGRDRLIGYYWPKNYPLPKIGPVAAKDLHGVEAEGSEA